MANLLLSVAWNPEMKQSVTYTSMRTKFFLILMIFLKYSQNDHCDISCEYDFATKETNFKIKELKMQSLDRSKGMIDEVL